MDATLVGELTADGSKIILIGCGDDMRLAYYAKLLHTLTPAFEKSKPAGALVAPATWSTVVQLGHAFGDAWQAGPRLTEWVRAELTSRVAVGGLNYRPPAGCTPRPYQIEGAAMIAATGRSLLFDDPGTGKTITTILGLVERAGLVGAASVFPLVVVAPASTVDPWVEAWQRWAPHIRAVAWRGTPAKRRKLLGTADVYVTSYDTCRMDAADKDGPLVKMRPNGIVADECHLIKTPDSMRSLAVRRLAGKAAAFVGLSGTPITHHPGDLWPALDALDPHSQPSRQRWIDRYCTKLTQDYQAEILGLHPYHETEFRATLLGQHRRVAKADVLAHLPPKVYSTRSVTLPPLWRKAYDDMENEMIADLPDGKELSVMSVLALFTRLAQLASAPADVEVTYGPEEDELTGELREHVHVTLKAPSWKVDELLAILAERPGQPVVAFAPSRQLMMLAHDAAVAAGLRVGLVVGGQNMTDRTATVERFQAGQLDLLCVTTGAGGVGLTLTAASTVVFLQRPWSLVEALQAEDRCHRIGSEIHDSIEVIDIVAAATIDSRVRAVLRDKAGQLADLLQDQRIVTELLGGSRRKAA